MKVGKRIWFTECYGDSVGLRVLPDDGRFVITPVGDEPIVLDRPKARELAAILTHFADTGELPGEVGDGQ